MFLFRHAPTKSASQDDLHPSGQPAADDNASGEYQPADDVLPQQAALLSGLTQHIPLRSTIALATRCVSYFG